jgi:hypothetical protein
MKQEGEMLKTLVRLVLAGATYLALSQMAAACGDTSVRVNGDHNQVIAITICPGSSSSPSLWNHNGSIVRLTANGPARRFFYEAPREALRTVGVAQGTLLFAGISQGGYYRGTAYIFHAGCVPAPYDVSGPIDDDNRGVTVYGDAPILDNACNIIDYRHDVLTFSFLGT